MNKFIRLLTKILNSRKLLIFILIFFVFESLWIAISAAYPQAFDEDFHFGLIKFYSNHLNPVLSSQPLSADRYGAVFRDPSFFYQYLLSFIYRLIRIFTENVLLQVIILRSVNIFLFLIGLIFFKKVLVRARISQAMSNAILLLFVLIPIVPQLAAQINYDNLLFPLTALSAFYSFKIIESLSKGVLKFRDLGQFIIYSLLACLTKYVFLPLLLGMLLFFICYTFIYKNKFKDNLFNLKSSFTKESALIKALLIGLIIIFSSMFLQRDVLNLIKYKNVMPQCSTIMTVDHCSKYGPWKFNYVSHNELVSSQTNGHNPIRGIGYFFKQCLYWMWFRLFFAINGPNSSYTNYPPLPLPCAAALGIFLTGIILFAINFKKILTHNPKIIFLILISSFYVIALFLQGFSTYKYTNVLENMNGRYLIPVLIPLAAILSLGFSYSFNRYLKIKYILALCIILLFIEGGGLLTFIDRSDDSWDVPNKTVRRLNNTARKITQPIIDHGNKVYYSDRWFFN